MGGIRTNYSGRPFVYHKPFTSCAGHPKCTSETGQKEDPQQNLHPAPEGLPVGGGTPAATYSQLPAR
ncbi:hypothetical protein SEA_ATUIN_3 [Arthrobacter phage Atuin]|nr:hypothetical protein SEA_ATUIN_102 [Arthrobacter phage Atuin]